MPLLEVRRLVKHFSRGGGLFAPSPTVVHAVDDVSFAIEEGDMFGLVGESGSGKSTTGRCILRLIEPTSGEVWFEGKNVTALDVTIQAQVLELLRDLKAQFNLALLLITHDFGVIAEMADRVAVMHKGRIVEQGTVRQILRAPVDPYTRRLLASVPGTRAAVVSSPAAGESF